jgi:3-oxoacyl-[acyl-carrier-protein] synthase-3
MTAYLLGFGSHVPPRVVTNAELAARVDRTPEWIEGASGIRERRWADPETSVADLGVAAAEDCLARTGMSASALGMVMVASGSASRGFPGPAAEVAARLGLSTVPAIDLPMASAGSLFGLALAMHLTETHGDILVIGAEKMSSVIEGAPPEATPPKASSLDPNTAILFGDGAGAALVSSRPPSERAVRRWRMLDAAIHTDGQFRQELRWSPGAPLAMNGLSVILQASRKIPAAISEVLARQGIAAGDVAVFLLHQANLNLIARVAKSLGVPPEKMFTNVERYGNTSSASMLIAAAEWAAAHPEGAPGPVVFAAFGAGYHWGAVVATEAAD